MKKRWIVAVIGCVIAVVAALLYKRTLKELGEMDFTMLADS